MCTYGCRAEQHKGIQSIKWLDTTFLRRNPIQNSIRLNGKGSSFVLIDHTIRMAEIRSTVSDCPLSMLYSMDETGLFYRMGPNRTYLLQSEDDSATGGTELQKQKQRITVVLCVNADGHHSLRTRSSISILWQFIISSG